jgi:tellurite resistance protein
MSNSHDRYDSVMTPAELMAARLADRKDEMLEAVLTATALVAAADGWIDPAERREVLAFLKRNDLARPDVDMMDEFERRVRELRQPGHVLAAAYRLGRAADHARQRLAVAAAWDVAVADERVDPRELRILDLIRVTLGARRARPVPPLGRESENR